MSGTSASEGPRDHAGSDSDRRARAVWSALAEPGDAVAGALVQTCGAAAALAWVTSAADTDRPDWSGLERSAGELDESLRRRVDVGVRRWAARWRSLDPERDRAAAQRSGARLVVPGDPAWPGGLDDLGALAPFALWVRGAPPTASRSVALVGARASTSYGERVTVDLAVELARRGWVVVSGGAYGIDAAAHRGALTGGGATHVVLAGGVDRAYPVGNAALLEEVVRAGGSLISEVPPGSTPTRGRFLQRNRLIAAVSHATVVVEAAWRSGAASTAHHAARLLRPVGAVPGPVTSAASAGCHRLLRDGVAVCVTDADEVVELAGNVGADLTPVPTGTDVRPTDGLDPVARRVHDGLSRRTARDAEQIAARAGTTPAQARAMLGLLELDGLARRVASGWVVSDAQE
ncbi:DNA-processing protein DprA [Cellulomonas xiejunii]|uniref:DNA-processing protein DprA n=1 Tax=Cellulomonas xiejunii TaxID=2968083 RepID=A0ABY5KTS5_9CELL|nr:DNA-processing protein DprA [Cellulomonas xiejunii]MCC2315360.1 DNA-processing protein DprA [Cellulomonas xiejunii]MCC2321943.1 DNA-processing protein DprA [Cellulomonas xiejunii]UUI73243.1 DNA-processing protein DprA [Cellulomonas xiejunii]